MPPETQSLPCTGAHRPTSLVSNVTYPLSIRSTGTLCFRLDGFSNNWFEELDSQCWMTPMFGASPMTVREHISHQGDGVGFDPIYLNETNSNIYTKFVPTIVRTTEAPPFQLYTEQHVQYGIQDALMFPLYNHETQQNFDIELLGLSSSLGSEISTIPLNHTT